MGCYTSKVAAALEDDVNATASKANTLIPEKSVNAVYPPAEAFVVSLNVEGETTADEAASLNQIQVMKQPPKRLRQLMEQAKLSTLDSSPRRIADLNAKMERAEERRQSYLQQRVVAIQRNIQIYYQNEGKADRNSGNI